MVLNNLKVLLYDGLNFQVGLRYAYMQDLLAEKKFGCILLGYLLANLIITIKYGSYIFVFIYPNALSTNVL